MQTSGIKAVLTKLIKASVLFSFVFFLSIISFAKNAVPSANENFTIYINGSSYQQGYFTTKQDIYVRVKPLKKMLNLPENYAFPPQIEWEHKGKTYVSLEGVAKILKADLEINWDTGTVKLNYTSNSSTTAMNGVAPTTQSQVNNYYNYYGGAYPYGFYPYYYPYPLFGFYYSDCWDWEWGCGYFDNFVFDEPIIEEPVVINIITSNPQPLPVVNRLQPIHYIPRPPLVGPYRYLPHPLPAGNQIMIHSGKFMPGFTPHSVYHPSTPAYRPSAPAYRPSAPAYHPSAPVYHPSAPAYRPSAPAYHPSAPAYHPSAPAYRPSAPAYHPSAPAPPPPPASHRR